MTFLRVFRQGGDVREALFSGLFGSCMICVSVVAFVVLSRDVALASPERLARICEMEALRCEEIVSESQENSVLDLDLTSQTHRYRWTNDST